MQIQGGSRRTWTSRSPYDDQVEFEIGSPGGRPVNAEVELWQGPGNTPVSMRVYGDDGHRRPVRGAVGTGYGRGRWGGNTVSVRNSGPLEFPIGGGVMANDYQTAFRPSPEAQRTTKTIQGGALRTYTFDPTVGSVEVLITSDGMPVKASIEVLQGPNSNRQGIELYSDDGRGKPISYMLETPGYGCTIQINNV